MSGYTKEDIDRLIVDDRIDATLPSTKSIFEVIHPILQTSALDWASSPQTFLDKVRIPKPFDSWPVRYTMYTRWGNQDRANYGSPHNMFFLYDKKPHLLIDKSTVSEPSQIGAPNSEFPPLTKLVGFFGALDEAGFISYLTSKTLLLCGEDYSSVAEFYQNRVRLMARIGAFRSNLRLTDENIVAIVERFNSLPHSVKVASNN